MDLVSISPRPAGPAAILVPSPAPAPFSGAPLFLPHAAGPDSPSSRRALSEREKQVLRLVCEGMSNAEIATRLGVSKDSIKTELKRIFQKISVKNRTQAAVLVTRQSMLAEQRL